MLKIIAVGLALGVVSAPMVQAQENEETARPERVHPERVRPAERLGALDRRLTRAELNGRYEQGTRADFAEDRLDRFEDRVDRRESRRDEAVDLGRRDVIEDRLDRAESVLDRRENRADRRRRGQNSGE